MTTSQERKSPAATGLPQSNLHDKFTTDPQQFESIPDEIYESDTAHQFEERSNGDDYSLWIDSTSEPTKLAPKPSDLEHDIEYWRSFYGFDKPFKMMPSAATTPMEPEQVAPIEADPFDLEAARVSPEWFTSEPPAREWLVRDLLPYGVVGILAAPGGTGKSLVLQQLALAVAGGLPFLGCEVDKPGAVVYLSAEDDRAELRRRLYAIGKVADGLPYLEVSGRLFMFDLVASGFKLTHSSGGGRQLTANALLVAQLREMIRQIGEVRLIVLDTYSRFNGGDENDNVHSAAFVQACEQIRQDTGCNVLVSAHTTKSARGAVRAIDVAGGARLVDSARWMAGLDRYLTDSKGECKPEDARHVRLSVGKSNYGQVGAQFYLEFRDGVLAYRPDAARPSKGTDSDDKSESRYQDVLARLRALIQRKTADGAHLTRRKLRDYAGREGPLGVGESVMRQVVARALEEGDLFFHQVDKELRLALWPQHGE